MSKKCKNSNHKKLKKRQLCSEENICSKDNTCIAQAQDGDTGDKLDRKGEFLPSTDTKLLLDSLHMFAKEVDEACPGKFEFFSCSSSLHITIRSLHRDPE